MIAVYFFVFNKSLILGWEAGFQAERNLKCSELCPFRICQQWRKSMPEVIIHKENRIAAIYSSSVVPPFHRMRCPCVHQTLGSTARGLFLDLVISWHQSSLGHLERKLHSFSRYHPCKRLSQYFLQFFLPSWKYPWVCSQPYQLPITSDLGPSGVSSRRRVLNNSEGTPSSALPRKVWLGWVVFSVTGHLLFVCKPRDWPVRSALGKKQLLFWQRMCLPHFLHHQSESGGHCRRPWAGGPTDREHSYMGYIM